MFMPPGGQRWPMVSWWKRKACRRRPANACARRARRPDCRWKTLLPRHAFLPATSKASKPAISTGCRRRPTASASPRILPAPSASTGWRLASSCAPKGRVAPSLYTNPDVFQPADPARAMPKWLIPGAIVAMLLPVLLIIWFNNRSLEGRTKSRLSTSPPPFRNGRRLPAAPQGQGPVVMSRPPTAAGLSSIKDGGVILKQGMMQP